MCDGKGVFEVDGITYVYPLSQSERAFGRHMFELRSYPHDDGHFDPDCDGECGYLGDFSVANNMSPPMRWDPNTPILRFTSDGLEVSYFKPVDVKASV